MLLDITALDAIEWSRPGQLRVGAGAKMNAIDAALNAKGTINGGVYQFNIPRAESITEAGMPVPPSMGTAIAINFQPTGSGKAAITGDFVLLG